jgi:hypothetical protein
MHVGKGAPSSNIATTWSRPILFRESGTFVWDQGCSSKAEPVTIRQWWLAGMTPKPPCRSSHNTMGDFHLGPQKCMREHTAHRKLWARYAVIRLGSRASLQGRSHTTKMSNIKQHIRVNADTRVRARVCHGNRHRQSPHSVGQQNLCTHNASGTVFTSYRTMRLGVVDKPS